MDCGGVSAYGVHQLRIAAGSVLLISEADREHAIMGTVLIGDTWCRAQPYAILQHLPVEICHRRPILVLEESRVLLLRGCR